MEILAADQMAGTIFLIEHFTDKILPGHPHHCFIKVGENDVFNSIKPMDQIRTILRGVDQLNRRIGIQVTGMPVKGKNGGGEVQLICAFLGALHQHAVPTMNAVKKSEGNGAIRRCSHFQINSPAFQL